jgi:hypothetical protein
MTDSGKTVHIVVTCTNRKTTSPSDFLKVRTLGRDSVEARATDWIERLASSKAQAIAARDLYCGEHWTVVKSMHGEAAQFGRTVRIWVVSAGYGLLPLDAEVRSYAATFCSGHVDTVGLGTSQTVWWQSLARWEGPAEGAPRSVTELIFESAGAPVLIALSPPYLYACTPDLLGAVQHAKPGQVSIVSAGTRGGPLHAWLLPCDARFQHALGGSLQALNVRIVSHLLRTHSGPIEQRSLSEALQELLAVQPAVVRYERTKVTDDELVQFIVDQLADGGRLSHSRLLRIFRDSGGACEQARFRSVYESVVGP